MNNLGNLLYVLLKPVPIAGMGHTRQERLIGNVFFVLFQVNHPIFALNDDEVIFEAVLRKPNLADSRKIDIREGDLPSTGWGSPRP